MKNNFALTMSLLLAFTLGGSYYGYVKATQGGEHGAAHTEPSAGHAAPVAAAPEAAAAGEGTQAPTSAGTTNNAGTPGVDNTNVAGATGNQPENTAATAKASAPAGDAAAGKEKFAGTCAGCHGMNAEGGVGPALAVTNAWTDDQFVLAVREGRTPEKTLGNMMPHFTAAQLTDNDVANIRAFVKTLN